VGASLVALPVRSAWANGITNSIVASGHGSDWAIGCTLSLLTLEEWANEIDINDADTTFVSVFGERGYNSKVHQGIRYNNDGSVKKISADRTLSEILQLRKPNKSAGKATWLAGPNDYNRLLVAMYLNAKYGNTPPGSSLHYPVANGRPFATPEAYATQLVELTYNSPVDSATTLKGIIENPANYQSL
tara:strand:- start:2226 stop:2789 length:564 start_codon:yes stop_codon:yes gene_type:complete